MADMFTNALDSIYTTLSVLAVIEDVALPVRVVDKTNGVEIETPQGHKVPTVTPAACVRVYDLTAAGVEDVVTIYGKAITFNGKTWKIINHRPRTVPTGESTGEHYLFLRKALP